MAVNWGDFTPVEEDASGVNWDEFTPVDEPVEAITAPVAAEQPKEVTETVRFAQKEPNPLSLVASGPMAAPLALAGDYIRNQMADAGNYIGNAYDNLTGEEAVKAVKGTGEAFAPGLANVVSGAKLAWFENRANKRLEEADYKKWLQDQNGIDYVLGSFIKHPSYESREKDADIRADPKVKFERAVQETIAKDLELIRNAATGGNKYAEDIYDVFNSTEQSASMIPLAFANPAAALTAFGASAGAQEYPERRNAGESPTQAIAGSTVKGLLEAYTEKLPLEMVMKAGSGFVKRVLSTMFTEAGEEGVNAAAGNLYDKATIKPDMTLGEYVADIKKSMVQGAAGGSITAAGMHPVVKAVESIKPVSYDQHNTPAGVLFSPTHTLSNGAEVQQATKAGKIVSGVYVDKAGKVFKDGAATRKPVDQNSVFGPLNAESQAEAIKAEVMGRGVTKPTEVNQGIINSIYGATPLRDPAQAFAGPPLPTDLATARNNQAVIDATSFDETNVARETIGDPISRNAQQPVDATMPVPADEQVSMLKAEAEQKGITDPVKVNQYVIEGLYGKKSQAEINQAEINRAQTGTIPAPKGIIASATQTESAPLIPTQQPSKTDALIEEREYLSGLLDKDAPPSAVREAMQIRVHNIDVMLKGNEPAKPVIPKGQFDPDPDDVLEFMRIQGGIDTEIESDWGGRFAHLNAKGKKNIEQPGKGKSLDDLAEKAYELGFIESHDRKEFEKLLDVAQSGKPVYSRYASGKDSKQARDSLKAEMERLKVDKEAKERKIEEDSMTAFEEEYSKLLDGNRFDKVTGPNGEVVPKVPPSMGRREDGRTETRRKNQSAREYYQSLSNDELMDIVLKHDLTGIKGRRAFVIEQKQAAHFVSVDADSLKWVNDNMSPDNGDKLLQTIGNELVAEFGYDNVYHISGDEFYVLGFDSTDNTLLKQGMQRVEASLGKQVITAEKPDGTKIELNGLAATPGYGTNKKEADNELKSEKTTREQSGERSGRGLPPASAVITAPEGQQDTQRDRAGADAGTGIASGETPVVQAESVVEKKSPFKKPEDPIQHALDISKTRDAYLSYLNGRLGKAEFARQKADIEARWDSLHKPEIDTSTPLYTRIPEGTGITIDGRVHKNARQGMQLVEERINAYEKLIKCIGG